MSDTEILKRAASFLDCYAIFMQQELVDLDRHPYLLSLLEAAEELRQMAIRKVDDVSTVDQVMADCEAFETAMAGAGYNRPDIGKYPGMYRYQRDQDRYTGWKLARAAIAAAARESE